ncbi:hypothetical protein AKJ37_00730 [candidate division MSBL1 archaeon SCGC-AAA259I09]|uniref:Uncharacterized protein n=1 Tax=candidate division MSBL1 archaeon SCGC-AAA259I09 TaxID=1698267 RepID=A0A133UVL0_9EURY|nr:hypothetical protein AKJ37_00730 [candidate division MSBL1 archaeon SCGC-AAA259I09]
MTAPQKKEKHGSRTWRKFSDYLFDLAEGYKSTKQFVDDNLDGLKERNLKPMWMRFAPLRNIRGRDNHGLSYGKPLW